MAWLRLLGIVLAQALTWSIQRRRKVRAKQRRDCDQASNRAPNVDAKRQTNRSFQLLFPKRFPRRARKRLNASSNQRLKKHARRFGRKGGRKVNQNSKLSETSNQNAATLAQDARKKEGCSLSRALLEQGAKLVPLLLNRNTTKKAQQM